MDSIKDFALKIKPFSTLFSLVLGALFFFGLGRISALQKDHSPVSIVKNQTKTSETIKTPSISTSPEPGSGEVIGSKNGTKYYLPWCGALKRIKPENRVVFASVALARQAGYAPAANCKGVN